MGSELLVPSHSPASYAEQFYAVFPYYLSIGMTYDQFWNQDATLAKYYREADEINRRKENQKLWLQGMYIYEALCDVSPVFHAFAKRGTKPKPYPEEPYCLDQKERDARDEARAKKTFEKIRAALSVRAAMSQEQKKEVAAGDD